MKKNLLLLIFACFALAFMVSSCKEDCEKDATGTLVMQNQSATNTTYSIIVDGTNEGTVSPGSEQSIELPSGSHSVQILNSSDNTEACPTISVNIVDCEKSISSCNY